MNKFQERLLENIENRGDSLFVTVVDASGKQEVTWRSLKLNAQRVIFDLSKRCADKGTVLIFLPHSPPMYWAFYGAMLGGYTPSIMPCPSQKQDPNIYWSSHKTLIDVIRPVSIVTDKFTQQQMKAAGLELDPALFLLVDELGTELGEFVDRDASEIAFLQHSSGTTGLKKGVALSFDAVYKHTQSYGRSLQLDESDCIVSWLPLYHDMGLIACMITPSFHATPVVQIDPFHWLNRPRVLFDLIEEHAATYCWLPNFAYDYLSNTLAKHASRFDVSSIKAFICCSEPCKLDSRDKFLKAFEAAGLREPMLQNCFAMAETVFAVSQTTIGQPAETVCIRKGDLKMGDEIELCALAAEGKVLLGCGQVMHGLEVEIVDEAGNPLSENRVGEIRISGQYLFSGYNQDPERTAKVLDSTGYRSGDIGFLRKGSLFVLGRKDDLIQVNGRNIYAHEIEAMINDLQIAKPGRVVAFSIPDESNGSEVLIVQLERNERIGVKDSDIQSSVVNALISTINVRPMDVSIVEPGELHKTSSGKISRSLNRKRYIEREVYDMRQAS